MDFLIRLRAAFLHLLVTAIVIAAVSSIVFALWFPGPFADMAGGKKLLGLILICDLALGPLVSLVIYNLKKPRRELIRDYCIVGAVQLAALIYGVSVVVDSRPVYIAFVVDRLEIVTASELTDEDLQQVEDDRYRSLPWVGPRLISVERPQDSQERQAILMSALMGKDIQLMPRYYQPYENALEEIAKRSGSVSTLRLNYPDQEQLIESALSDLDREEGSLRWLPVRHRFGFWVALIDVESGKPLRYLPIDPYAG